MICPTCGGELKVACPSGVMIQKAVGFELVPEEPVQDQRGMVAKGHAASAYCPKCERPNE